MKVLGGEKRKIAAIGTCWGTLATMTIFGESKGLDFLCGIQYHPSTKACAMEGNDEWELTAKVTAPQLILAAENDVKEYKPGGSTILSLEKTAPGSKCLPAMPGTVHGYVPRGDINDPKVKETVVQ